MGDNVRIPRPPRFLHTRGLRPSSWDWNRICSPMPRTKIPMLFINGPGDPNSGVHMVERYRALIPNPKTVMLSGGIGHWPQLESPEGTARQIVLFFRTVAA